MRLVITGSSGFLGTNLILELLNSTDYNIIAFTTNPNKLKDRYLMPDGRLMVISDIGSIKWDEVDILLNLAFPRNSDGVQMAKGLKFIADLFMVAKKRGVGSVINISSQSVYSQFRKEPASEETELNLETKYAVGKYTTELLLNSICNDIPHTNIRLASLIGKGFDQRITNKLVLNAIKGEPIKIEGGRQRFGFLDVRDAARGITKIISSNSVKWSTQYNLGTSESYTLDEIAKCVIEVSKELDGKDVEYKLTNDNVEIDQNTQLNCDLFKEQFGFETKYILKDSIEEIYRNCLKGNNGCSF